MSVLIVGKFKGDTSKFNTALAERGDEFAAIGERARQSGCIHHRFGVGDGFVVVVDEWGSVDQFNSFFSDPELQGFIASTGASAEPPELVITEAINSPDEF
jgi:hypothetical protein